MSDLEVRRLTRELLRTGLDAEQVLDSVLSELQAANGIRIHTSTERRVLASSYPQARDLVESRWVVTMQSLAPLAVTPPKPKCPTCGSSSACVYGPGTCPALGIQAFDPENPPPAVCEICPEGRCTHFRPQRGVRVTGNVGGNAGGSFFADPTGPLIPNPRPVTPPS